MPKIKKEVKDWFDYPDDPFNGRALIRLPKPGEIESIKEKSRELVVKEFRQAETLSIRATGVKEAIAVAAFLDWENFIDVDGEQMKCTKAHVLLMCKEAGFLEWMDDCLKELEERAHKEAKAELKN